MSKQARDDFKVLVKVAHEAIDEYAEARLHGEPWFERGLDNKIQNAVHRLLAFGMDTNAIRLDEE